jgi:hypothetical protein
MIVSIMEQTGRVELKVAAQAVDLPVELVRKLVLDGVVEGSAGYPATRFDGWCNLAKLQEIATKLHAARQAAAGREMSAYEAFETYNFHPVSIYNWVEKGWIKVLKTSPGGQKKFDEGDIAFAHALAQLTGHTAGKKLFPKKVE